MDLAVQVLLSGLGGAFGAGIAAWFAFRRFRSERWWELRVQAYTRLLERLYAEIEQAGRIHTEISELGDKASNPEFLNKVQAQYMKSAFDFGRIAVLESFYLSRKANSIINDFLFALGHTIGPNGFRSFRDKARETLENLKQEAKRDLHLG